MEEIKFYGAARGKSGSGKTGVGREGSPRLSHSGVSRHTEGRAGGRVGRSPVSTRNEEGTGVGSKRLAEGGNETMAGEDVDLRLLRRDHPVGSG